MSKKEQSQVKQHLRRGSIVLLPMTAGDISQPQWVSQIAISLDSTALLSSSLNITPKARKLCPQSVVGVCRNKIVYRF